MNAALGQIGENWGGTCSRVNQLAWKGKSKKLQNMEGKKLGIHLEILASCRGYVSNCLSAGSSGLHRLMSDAFVLCSKSQVFLLSLLLLPPVLCSDLKKGAGFSLYCCAWELFAAGYPSDT